MARHGIAFAIVVFASLVSALDAQANTVAFARAQAAVTDNPVRSNVNENESEARASAVSQGSYVRDGERFHGSASVTALAIAKYGILAAGAGGAASNGGEGFSTASSIFSDSLIIDKAGHRGNRSFVRIAMEPTWRIVVVEPTSTAQATLTLNLMAGNNVARWETTGRPGHPPQESLFTTIDGESQQFTTPFDGRANFSIPFNYGDTISVFAQLTTSGSVFTTGRSEGQSGELTFGNYSASATRTAYWGGLSVFDTSGAEVFDFTLLSASGTDWRQSFIPSVTPIPEPSTYATLAAGIGLMWFARRRKASSPSRS